MVSEDVATARYPRTDGTGIEAHVRSPSGKTAIGTRNRETFRLLNMGGSVGSTHGREFVYIEEPTPGHEAEWLKFKQDHPQFFKENGGTGYIENVRLIDAENVIGHARKSMFWESTVH